MRQPAKVFIRVRPLGAFAADEANEAYDEDIEARHWRRRSSHNPGDGGERAVAFLADAPRAAGWKSRCATSQNGFGSLARPSRADARANRALSRRSVGRRSRGRDLSALRRGGGALAARVSARPP